jgi:hypothetical protein
LEFLYFRDRQLQTMKKLIYILVVLFTTTTFAQKENKLITAKNVERIIKTLSADDMMGRPASDPAKIEKATAFIESEFKKIGLQPMKGLTSYRQEFTKERISPGKLEVVVNGEIVPSANTLLASEQAQIDLTSGLIIKRIDADASGANPRQYFFGKASAITRDTANALVIVAPENKEAFEEFKGFFKSRFTSGRKGTKVFVLGNYAPTSYSIKATQVKENMKLANVVGILTGKTKPDEFVVFSGHFDHIGIQKPVDGDSIANGADDDASGTTAVIELARYFKKIKNNNRSIIFVAFTAEEIGGFGSRYFSEQLNPGKVMAMFNIEMIGKLSKFGKNHAFITGYERSDFGEILQKNLAGTPFNFKPDPYPEQNLFYRSDNATLARLGVPAHTISTDQIDIDKLYHTVNDEFESMDIENIVATIRAIALSSKTIVNGFDTPKRIDKSMVR